MSAFVDKMLLQLSDPASLADLVAPAADPQHQRLKSLLQVVYDVSWATLHDVTKVEVTSVEFERPIFPPKQTYGTWTQTIPTHTRTDVYYQELSSCGPEWIDAVADLALTVVLGEIDLGEIESVLAASIDDFTTLGQFKSKFQFLDLDAFMAEHEITTVEELKGLGSFVLGEIKLKAVSPFDPLQPGPGVPFRLQLAFLVRDTIDVASALREAKRTRAVIERAIAYRREVEPATEVLTPYAPVLVFPQAAVAGSGLSEAALTAFFADERILALFTNP
jgi:hypothetical protein